MSFVPPTGGAGAPPPPWTWSFLGSTIVALIAIGAQALAIVVIIVMLNWSGLPITGPFRKGWIYLAVIVSCPFSITVLWVAIRIARQGFADYLALRWSSWKDLAIGVALTLAFVVARYLLAIVLGETASWSDETYQSVKGSGWLVVYLVALCIVMPMMREVVTCGFLFRGWSQSFLGPIGAVVLIPTAWTLLGLANLVLARWAGQDLAYDLFHASERLVAGLLFSYLRYRSGSTWLPMLSSSAINIASTIEIAWLSFSANQ